MLTVGALVFLAIGIAVPAVLLMKLWRDPFLRRRGVTTEGQVVAVSTGDDSDWPIIAFRDARGRAHQFRSDAPCASGSLRVGAAVGVRYDPADPRRARERGRPAARAIHFASWLFIGTTCAVIGAMLLPI